jgi:hypothetical protein
LLLKGNHCAKLAWWFFSSGKNGKYWTTVQEGRNYDGSTNSIFKVQSGRIKFNQDDSIKFSMITLIGQLPKA